MTWRPSNATRAIFSYTKIGIVPESKIKANASLPQNKIDELLFNLAHSAPSDTTSVTLMQKIVFGAELSAAWYDIGPFKWTNSAVVHRYQRLDWRLAYPFSLGGGAKGEVAWTARGDGGSHAEWDAEAGASQALYPRHFLSLRLDY